MSHVFIKAACASAGLVLALAAAGTVYAAKPIANSKPNTLKKSLTVKQKNELAAARARNHTRKAAPKTMAQAAKTLTLMDDGSEVTQVPDELQNYLFAVRDAQGNLRILESDGSPQPKVLVTEISDEK